MVFAENSVYPAAQIHLGWEAVFLHLFTLKEDSSEKKLRSKRDCPGQMWNTEEVSCLSSQSSPAEQNLPLILFKTGLPPLAGALFISCPPLPPNSLLGLALFRHFGSVTLEQRFNSLETHKSDGSVIRSYPFPLAQQQRGQRTRRNERKWRNEVL